MSYITDFKISRQCDELHICLHCWYPVVVTHIPCWTTQRHKKEAPHKIVSTMASFPSNLETIMVPCTNSRILVIVHNNTLQCSSVKLYNNLENTLLCFIVLCCYLVMVLFAHIFQLFHWNLTHHTNIRGAPTYPRREWVMITMHAAWYKQYKVNHIETSSMSYGA